jgi:uncharacterized protein
MGKKAMRENERVSRLRIYLSEDAKYHERPLYEEIVVRAQYARLAGATVFRGELGYSKASTLSARKILHSSKDIPIVIEILDNEGKINAFLSQLDELLTGGIATVETVQMHRYSHKRALELA